MKNEVPGTPIAKGNKRAYGAKIRRRMPIKIVPKQNAIQDIKMDIVIIQVATPKMMYIIPIMIRML